MHIVKTLSKSILFALLFTLMASQIVRAEVRVYKSNSNMPFIRMMLGMMDAMGVLDRVPTNSAYGGYPSSPWSNSTNPYMRALARRGIYPGSSSSLYKNPYMNNLYGNNAYSGYGQNPFIRSPWGQSPWTQSGQYGSPYASPPWGSPDWGVLPTQSYSAYGYPNYGQSYWSSSDLDGWVNEPWETSDWNSNAERSNTSTQTQAPQQIQAPQPNVPLVQNFNLVVPENVQPDRQRNEGLNTRQGNALSYQSSSPLSKLAPPGPPAQGMNMRPATPQRSQSPLYKRTMQQPGSQRPGSQQNRKQPPRGEIRQRPCVTEFCGLKKPSLNGLWVTQNGEILGVNKQKFLWSDGTERYLTGEIKIQNEYLVARVEGREQLLHFKYKLAGDHLLTMQPDGMTREFIRMSPEQYYQHYGNNYGGY